MAIQLVIPLTNPFAPNAVVITIDEADLDLVLAHRWEAPTFKQPHVLRVDAGGKTTYLFNAIYSNSGKPESKIRFDNGVHVDFRRDNLVEKEKLPVAVLRSYPRPNDEERKLNDPYKEKIDELRKFTG